LDGAERVCDSESVTSADRRQWARGRYFGAQAPEFVSEIETKQDQ
jgi:hypothetical protein